MKTFNVSDPPERVDDHLRDAEVGKSSVDTKDGEFALQRASAFPLWKSVVYSWLPSSAR